MTAEQTAFVAEYYLAKREFLLEYAIIALHNYHLSEDAVQQTFEIACRKIDDFYNSPNPGGWLTRVEGFVIRNIYSLQRTEQKYIIHPDEYKPDLVAAPEKPLSLRATYGPLVDTPQFQLLYEAEVMGRSLKEIARDLDISEDACKKRAERARKFLQQKLRK